MHSHWLHFVVLLLVSLAVALVVPLLMAFAARSVAAFRVPFAAPLVAAGLTAFAAEYVAAMPAAGKVAACLCPFLHSPFARLTLLDFPNDGK